MTTDILVTGNIAIREMRFGGKAGTVVEGHEHNFDHMSYVPRGAVRFELLDDQDVVVKTIVKKASDGYNFILIKAGRRHRITAETDDALLHCIYSHRTPQGDVVQEYDGWAPAYL